MAANLGLLVTGFIIANSSSFTVFLMAKFLVGGFQQSAGAIAVAYTLELFPSQVCGGGQNQKRKANESYIKE